MNLTYDNTRIQYFTRLYASGLENSLIPDDLYPKVLTSEDIFTLYDFSGLAQRIVSVFPEQSWKSDIYVYETEEFRVTAFEEAWDSLYKKLKLSYYFEKADVLSGIGRFGVMVLGFNDGKSLDKPCIKASELLYIRCLSEQNVQIEQTERDINSPRYGYPTLYRITLRDEASGASVDKIVHWSRIIHVAETVLDSELFGVSRIWPVRYRVIDVERILGSSSAGYYRHGIPGVFYGTDPDADVSDDDVDAIKSDMKDYASGVNRYMFGRGIVPQMLQASVTDPETYVRSQYQYICAFLGVPLRVFMGSESGQYASSQDRNTFQDKILVRQTKFCKPVILEPFVDRLIQVGVLPKPGNNEYQIAFKEENLATPLEKAQTAKMYSECLKDYIVGGVGQLIPFKVYLSSVMKLSDAEVEAIDDSRDGFVPDIPQLDLTSAPRGDNGEIPQSPKDSVNYR